MPYAIHTATGIGYNIVLDAAKRFGWNSHDGMTAVGGWCVLRDLGVFASSMRVQVHERRWQGSFPDSIRRGRTSWT
ncbi:hypothetical protein [Caballeronia sp. dw_276]|uniref:hypothetical protein n=1 Tax=Caballeronia sp. dw_276 TaxID=2719795 RepID=UPI001BD24D67|nr:hypothetical protein [Caballeronia sp. dw_276]